MWLILTEPFDPAGPWLSDGLAARTGQLFSLFTSHDVGRDARYEHGRSGDLEWFRLHTHDGAVIDSRMVRGVVNCLFSMPPGLSSRMNPAERSAAVRNFSAPLMRWLHHYAGPVINRPNAQGICGDIRMPAEWAAIAEASGLPCLPGETEWASFSWLTPKANVAQAHPIQRMLVVGDAVLSISHPEVAVPASLARACLRLSVAAHAPLLGIDLAHVQREMWCFVGAHRRPDLKPGGLPVLDAIVRALGLAHPGASQPPHQSTRERERDGTGDFVSAFSAMLRRRTGWQAH